MRAALLLACVLTAACGGRGRGSETPAPMPNRPLDAYARQGLITGSDEFPAVAGFATLGGPNDSTWLLFSMSLPTSALRFHRDESGFVAGYAVSLGFQRDGTERARSDRSARVRVASFEETGRTDESLVYQDWLLLEPGRYVVDVAVLDSIGTRGLAATDTIDVPAYRAGSSAILLVHEATMRTHRAQTPRLVSNSRRTATFGGPPPHAYVEIYDSSDAPLEIVVRDAAGTDLATIPLVLARAGIDALRSATIALPVDSLTLGIVTLSVQGAAWPADASTPMLVTISDQWMVANYSEVLDYLAYIASREEIDRLRQAATPAERRAAWDEFWELRDPVPASPVNEYREEFFHRVRAAAEQFAEVGRPGWRTARGEVYIVLGPPDRATRGELGGRDLAGVVDAIEWIYDHEGISRLELLFVDRDGFGRFELTRNSELAFRATADRLRPRGD